MSKKINLKPLGARIAILPEQIERETASGIVLATNDEKEKPGRGTVVAVGEGKRLDNGELSPISVKIGDTVLFSKYSGEEVEIDKKKYLILDESSVLAIIK